MENLTPPAAAQNGRFAGCGGVDHPAGGSDAGGRWAALAGLSSSAAGAAAVRSGKAGRLWALCRWGQGWRWCVVIVGGGLLLAWSSGAALAVLILPGAGGGRNIRVLRPALPGYFPAFPRGGTTPSACRSADPAGRAGGRRGRWAKEKGQGGGAWCAAALAFCLHLRCDLLRRVRPGAYRGRWGSAPRSGAGLLALALIRAQRFQLATFQHGTACAGGAPSGAFLPFAGGVRFST